MEISRGIDHSPAPAQEPPAGPPASAAGIRNDFGQQAAAMAKAAQCQRRLAVGAEILPNAGVHFRVWAPRRQRVDVILDCGRQHSAVALAPEGHGYFSGIASNARAGMLYRFRLDDDPRLYPDPASRFQPDGPHGASEIVDPSRFEWTDDQWTGVPAEERVIYELHVGTFTREGTWQAAVRELAELARLGVTVVELMPLADFPGRFGWGYDGVDQYAPTRLYGEPDDFRRFVDSAHRSGIAVILDVVYNHLGPDGCYLRSFSKDYFTNRYTNEWGEPINFDGDNAGPVREFFTENARYWIDEFHVDGLRLDATQQIFDSSEDHIIAALARAVREAGGSRATFIVCENEPQEVRLVRAPEEGGYGADALWNDDFHHMANVALTGRNEAYYVDYSGRPQEFISSVKWGYLYQGQLNKRQNKRRGTATFGFSPTTLVNYIQNHDQIANSAFGERIHKLSSPGVYRAVTAVLLLSPQIPMLFQGQEFAASSPFLFFADHKPELAGAVRRGRAAFLGQFPSLATPEMQSLLADPGALETFARCKLDFSERERHREAYNLHRDLLHLRHTDPVFSRSAGSAVDGAVLGDDAFVFRFFGKCADDRLLLVNLGRAITLQIAPEPLLAAPDQRGWRVLWSSDAAQYGGAGFGAVEVGTEWRIPGHAALVLAPECGA